MDQTIVAVVALAVGTLGFLLAMSAHKRLSAARRSLLLLQGAAEGPTLLEAVAAYAAQVRAIEGDLGAVARRQEELFAVLGRSTRNLGVVRYDAFEDMGGQMSFSAALLDDHGNGVVMTSINGRSDARTYAKSVEGGRSDHNLSREEQEAIAEALGHRAKVRGRR